MIKYNSLIIKYNDYYKYLISINKPNIGFRLAWLYKAEKYTNKGIDYIIYNKETLEESKRIIYSLATHKPNRIWNQVLLYKKFKARD